MRICAKCGSGFTGRKSRYCSLECSGDISRNFRHGQCNSREYQSWRKMRSRCLCPTFLDYPHYGGRGITICERWEVFENFLADMGPRPEGRTLDRIDNNGNYEPGNCRWATRLEQSQNRRPYSEWNTKRRKAEVSREESRPICKLCGLEDGACICAAFPSTTLNPASGDRT